MEEGGRAEVSKERKRKKGKRKESEREESLGLRWAQAVCHHFGPIIITIILCYGHNHNTKANVIERPANFCRMAFSSHEITGKRPNLQEGVFFFNCTARDLPSPPFMGFNRAFKAEFSVVIRAPTLQKSWIRTLRTFASRPILSKYLIRH